MQNDAASLLQELQTAAAKAVGSNRVLKAIADGRAVRVFLAKDVEHFLSQTIINNTQIAGIPLTMVDSREELAKHCKVSVKTAAAAILR